MALACLWSPGIRLLANRTHGVVVKRLFVSRPGRSLAVFGRHSIGIRSIALTPISVAAAPRLLTRRERRLPSWCSRWAKMAWPTCLTATVWEALPRQSLQKTFLALSEVNQLPLTTRAREHLLFFIPQTPLLQLTRLPPAARLPYPLRGACARA